MSTVSTLPGPTMATLTFSWKELTSTITRLQVRHARIKKRGRVSQSYQARIQCWAIIGAAAKRNLNGVSLAGR